MKEKRKEGRKVGGSLDVPIPLEVWQGREEKRNSATPRPPLLRHDFLSTALPVVSVEREVEGQRAERYRRQCIKIRRGDLAVWSGGMGPKVLPRTGTFSAESFVFNYHSLLSPRDPFVLTLVVSIFFSLFFFRSSTFFCEKFCRLSTTLKVK